MQKHKKDEIIQSFESEDSLRVELIIPLFRKLGYKVFDNQGTDEYGTDVILKETNRLGTDEYTSIVLKKGDINNRSGSASSIVRVIYDQIFQAMTSNLDYPGISKNIFPNSVWIATNGKISKNAKNIFHKMLTEQFTTPVNVEYIDKEKLIDLVDEYWPEFYLDRRPFLSQYSDILKNQLVGVNVSEIGGSDRSIDSILIPQLLSEKKDFSVKSSERYNFKKSPLTPLQLLKIQNAIVYITGEAGCGKSTLLKRLAIDVLRANEGYAPIAVGARDLVGVLNINEFLIKSIDVNKVSSTIDDVRSELINSKIILLVDGLDEIRKSSERKGVIDLLDSLVNQDNNIEKVIISTRPESENEVLIGAKKSKSYEVLPVKNQHISSFFLKWFGSNGKSKANQLFSELESKSILEKLPKTPLTITLLAILYETKGDIPTTLTELYKMFTELLLGKWDHKKGINTLKNAQVNFGLLSHIAWIMHSEGKSEISQDEIIYLANDFFKEKLGDKSTKPKEAIQTIIERSGLLIPLENNFIKFKHFSFQEYFCSQEVYSKSAFSENLTNWFDDSWWSEVLFFSAGSLRNIDDFTDKLMGAPSEDKMTSSMALGGMLQAAYETSVENKQKLIAHTRENLFSIMHDIKTLLDKKSPENLPRFIPYAVVMSMLSNNYSSPYLNLPLENLLPDSIESDEAVIENLFIAMSMAKSGNIRGIEELRSSPYINNPIALLLSDIALSEYEGKFNDGKITSVHKSIRKKIKGNSKAIRALISSPSKKNHSSF